MGVRYLPIDGEIVSAEWHVVLTDMRADISFIVREGKRTMARQWYFYNGWLRRLPGFNLAAFPSPFAPHIREGRIDHAIDFSNDSAVFSWLQRHGLQPVRTVRGESWHIECNAAALRAYAERRGRELSPLRFLGKAQHKAAATLLYRRRKRKAERASGKGPRWRRWDRLVRRSYRKVAGLRKRTHGRRARVLKRVLRDKDGRL